MPAVAYPGQLSPFGHPRTQSDGKLTPAAAVTERQIWNRTGGGTGIVNKVNQAVAAGGNSQATATQLTHDWHVITEGQGGVVMKTIQPGQDVDVVNQTGKPQNVYPFAGAQIGTLGMNAPYSLPAGKGVTIRCYTDISMGAPQLMAYPSS